MKNIINSRVVKAITVTIVAAVFFISNPIATLANGGTEKGKLSEEQVSVKYVGANEQHLVFHVDLQNPTGEKFWLIIRNDAGDVVYRKQFSDAHFSKTIYFENEGAEIRPTFIIRNNEGEITRQFAVTKTITENTVVTKL